MKQSLFDYLDYKRYLGDWIALRPHQGHGERSRIARVLRCHVAYVSQVLNAGAHLSPEQAEALNRHLGHAEAEADYFLLLVLYGRAGSASLRDYYARKLREAQQRRLVLKNRLEYKRSLSREDQALYYSAWYYAAIHLLIAIPEFQTKEALQRRLRVSLAQVSRVLSFLVATGLAVEEGGRFARGPTSLHLESDSPMIAKHHTNWRMRAIVSFDREEVGELHYSSAVTIAREDAARLKKILIEAIEKIRPVVRESKDEDLFCYSVDLFRVSG